MRIAQVCPRYFPDIGGVETHVRELSERLVQHGHQVEIICTDPSGNYSKEDSINGVKITRFPAFAPRGTIFFSPKIGSYIGKKEFDIVHIHNYHAFPAYHASRTAKGKLVFTPHYHGKGSTGITNALLIPYKLFGRKIFDAARAVICVSDYERDLLIRDFHLDPSKTHVIPNGIDLEAIKRAEPFSDQGNIILYIGRLEKYKHIDVVIRAMPFIPDSKFYIIGGAGNYRSELINLVRDLGLEDRVRFLGHVTEEEKYRWLKTCSLLVNLSDTEAFGITVLEALAAGKPVVVNPVSALGEFVGKFEGVYPYTIKQYSNHHQLTELIKLILDRKKEMYLDLKNYNWNHILKLIEEIYLIMKFGD